MSVVNTMLRELADRQQQVPALAAVEILPVAQPSAPRLLWPWWLGAVAVLAGSIFLWRWSHQDRNTSIERATSPTAQSVATSDISAAPGIVDVPANNNRAESSKEAAEKAPLQAIPITATRTVQGTSERTTPGKAHAAKPASIGWELVEAENPELTAPLPIVDAEPDQVETAAPLRVSPKDQAPAVFERQPAQQSMAEQLAQWRQQARIALAANDWRGADLAVRQGLQLQADDSELLLLHLQVDSMRDPQAAIARAEALLQIRESNWPIRQWLGTQYLQQQQFTNALNVLQQHAPELTEAPDYHAVLALAEQQTGDHTAAVARYRALLSLQPEHGRHYAGLALSLEPLGDRAGALSAWRAALRDPQLPLAVAQFGRQRLQQLTHAMNTIATPRNPASAETASQVSP